MTDSPFVHTSTQGRSQMLLKTCPQSMDCVSVCLYRGIVSLPIRFHKDTCCMVALLASCTLTNQTSWPTRARADTQREASPRQPHPCATSTFSLESMQQPNIGLGYYAMSFGIFGQECCKLHEYHESICCSTVTQRHLRYMQIHMPHTYPRRHGKRAFDLPIRPC